MKFELEVPDEELKKPYYVHWQICITVIIPATETM
mgnify:CR=1 FL=1